MERRRLAVLCSHLRQVDRRKNDLVPVSLSSCDCSSDKGSEEQGCIFCMIVRGESPAFKLYEDDLCLCILDSSPLTHGHSLIVPKSHFSSLQATPPSVIAAMCSTVPFLSSAIMKATQCDAFNLLVNNGAAAGQVIFHTHLHIIPRKENDLLWTSESFQRRRLKLNQETSHLADCIRDRISLPNHKCDAEKGQGSKLYEDQRQ